MVAPAGAAAAIEREVGKRCDVELLRGFLAAHAERMPRTMLRYAIERLPEPERKRWLSVRPAGRGRIASR